MRKLDLYTKVILTIIAISLSVLAINEIKPINSATAQASLSSPVDVNIVSINGVRVLSVNGVLPTQIEGTPAVKVVSPISLSSDSYSGMRVRLDGIPEVKVVNKVEVGLSGYSRLPVSVENTPNVKVVN